VKAAQILRTADHPHVACRQFVGGRLSH
jgi:hypothetical protein